MIIYRFLSPNSQTKHEQQKNTTTLNSIENRDVFEFDFISNHNKTFESHDRTFQFPDGGTVFPKNV